MRVVLITDKPDHPVLAAAVALLREQHAVEALDPALEADAGTPSRHHLRSPADVYLLKSHSGSALEIARRLEQVGAPVVNSFAATIACQDRMFMTERMNAAHIPAPPTMAIGELGRILDDDAPIRVGYPLMLKSRISRRGDLVSRVDTPAAMVELAAAWPGEPVVVQPFVVNDGWDRKVWVVDGQVFAARRRTPLDEVRNSTTVPLPATSLPREWVEIAHAVGEAFGMRLYGLDIVLAESGPVVVDVNAFPGFRGVPGAAEALACFVAGRTWMLRRSVTA